MIPNQIEREIVIDAPVEVVWRIVTEPSQIMKWFSDEAEFELRAGAEGRMAFKSGSGYALQIEAVDPPRRFAFRWASAGDPRPRERNSMLVEFTLQREDEKTRLRMVESGFEHVDWSDDEMARYADDHAHGWDAILPRLIEYAQTQASSSR